jgi:3-oxoacyl-(acyl-carrier-protein) synthase
LSHSADELAIVGLARADAVGLVSSEGLAVTWAELETEPGGTSTTFHSLFGTAHGNFRRFDRSARLLAMACEAAGVGKIIPKDARQETAVLVETELGCLATDLRFAASLSGELPDSSAFPYTLANTSLGELAIRYGLCGPTLCLSVPSHEDGLAFAEARRLLEDGSASYAVVGRVECLEDSLDSWEATSWATVAVLARRSSKDYASRASVVPWPDSPRAVFAGLGKLLPVAP